MLSDGLNCLRPFSLLCVAASVGLGVTSGVRAQVSPNGAEFQVNGYTTNYQMYPAVAADAGGNFVVVWASRGSAGTDSSYRSIQARRFADHGTPLGGDFQVNTYTLDSQNEPAVACGAAGNFVVVWASFGSAGSDADGFSVQAQRFAANGTRLGGEFQVNSYTTGGQRLPAVAADSAGNFVVVWQSPGSSGTDSDLSSVQARRFTASGAPLGSEFQVNSYTTGAQESPAVTADAAGNFVVTWTSLGSSGSDSDGDSIQAQRFAADGTPQGSQFQVNSYTPGDQDDPGVAADGLGNVVLVWHSPSPAIPATRVVFAQRYDGNGVPLGGEFQVNTQTMSIEKLPAVAADGGGRFVVVWEGARGGGSDPGWSILGRRFSADGTPLSAEFAVNTYTTGYQALPAVAAGALGDFVVVWQSFGSPGTDTSGYSIQAQRYDGLFRDGFETGNSGRWSSTVP